MFVVSRTCIFSPQCGQVRHSSGKLKELGIRLKAITNIQKITKTMKMISAAKYAQAEKVLAPARTFGMGAVALSKKNDMKAEPTRPKQLFVTISSDRGLCGALHSNMSRAAKLTIEERPEDVEKKIVTVGEKSKQFLMSTNSKQFLMECKEIGRTPPSFSEAVTIAEAIMTSGYEFDQGEIFYNYFKSAMSQVITNQPFFSRQILEQSDAILAYDSVDSDVLECYQEFQLASTLFYTMKENYTSEQGARMVSMDGATKNAGEMIEKMSLLYNRTRQAVITTELTEIISGMTAL